MRSRVSWSPRRRWAATRARSWIASSVRPPGPTSRPSDVTARRWTSISLPSTAASTCRSKPKAVGQAVHERRAAARAPPRRRRRSASAASSSVGRLCSSSVISASSGRARGGRAAGVRRRAVDGSPRRDGAAPVGCRHRVAVGGLARRRRSAASLAVSPSVSAPLAACRGGAPASGAPASGGPGPAPGPRRASGRTARLGSSRTSNSASSATTPSWSRASSLASSTVLRGRLDPLHHPLRSSTPRRAAASATRARRRQRRRLPPLLALAADRARDDDGRFDCRWSARRRRAALGRGRPLADALGRARRRPPRRRRSCRCLRRPWPTLGCRARRVPARSLLGASARRARRPSCRRRRRRLVGLGELARLGAGPLGLAAERLVVAVEAPA